MVGAQGDRRTPARQGADVNAKDGYTPLHEAAAAGQKEVVELLIAKGAHVNARDVGGATPLHYAGINRKGVRGVAELLIAKGADVNAKGDTGDTPLNWAARRGHREDVELLIAMGADINAKDKDGKTVLQWAIHETRDAVAVVLLNAGAKE